jgi:hypothetical protein
MKRYIIFIILLLSLTAHAEDKGPTPDAVATDNISLTAYGIGTVFECPPPQKFKTCFKLDGSDWRSTTPGMDPKPGDKVKALFTLNKIPESDKCSNYGDEMYVTEIKILEILK